MTLGNPAGGSIKFDNYDGNHGHQAFIEVIAPDSYNGLQTIAVEAAREETADFNFKQTNNGTLNTRFTIKGETGRVGIGSEIPTQKLDVHGGITAFSNANNFIVLNPSDGSIELKRTGGPFIDFADSGGDDHDCRIKQEDNGLAFTTGGNGSATEKLRIRGDGQVVYTPMTTTQRAALTAQEGGVIYNSTANKLQVYNGSAWVDLH